MLLSRLAFVVVLGFSAVAAQVGGAQEVNVVGQRLKTFVNVNGDGSGEVKVEPGALRNAIVAHRANVVDAGSLQTVNYKQWDTAGVLWHYTGTRWTSHSEARSDVTRTAIGNRPVVPVQTVQTRSRTVATTRSATVAAAARTSTTTATAVRTVAPAAAPTPVPASGRGVHVRW